MKAQYGDKSVKLQFQIPSNVACMFVWDQWLSNRHWLVYKPAVMRNPALKATFKHWLNAMPGVYEFGTRQEGQELPDLNKFLPSRENYKPAELSGRVTFSDTVALEIVAVWLSSETATAAIAARYAGLLVLGKPYIRSNSDPVLLLGAYNEINAVIMPRRDY
jgi:hypothetical protein